MGSEFTIYHPTKGNNAGIKEAAKLLSVPHEKTEHFVSDVLQALALHQIFKEEIDGSATPAEMLASMNNIKSEAERLRRRSGFHQIRRTLDAMISTCEFWNTQLAVNVRAGRRQSQALRQSIIWLRLTLMNHAPQSSDSDIVKAACTCLDAVDIKYPDPVSHPDRFQELFDPSKAIRQE